MPKLPDNFNWKKSNAHIFLLGDFEKPRNIKQIINREYLKYDLKENPEHAIERFFTDGFLINADIYETLLCIFTAEQLNKLVKERNLEAKGIKKILIEKLVTCDQVGMETITKKYRVMKCSQVALTFLEEYKKRFQLDQDNARKQSFEFLINNNLEEACKVLAGFERKYSRLSFDPTYYVGELMRINKCNPTIFSNMSPEDLLSLKVAASMHVLWRDDSAEAWLPENFSSGMKSNHIALNYLFNSYRINQEIESRKSYAKKVRILFDHRDIDSCDLCRALEGKTFDINEVPDFPLTGCTSETGCRCHIKSNFEYEDETNPRISISPNHKDEDDSSPLSKLRQLKIMLEEGLIMQDEFDIKKEKILARL